MNVWPLVAFYMRRHEQIGALLEGSGALPDLLRSNIPVIKKHWPQYNADGLLDDLLAAVNAAMAPSIYPDPSKQVRLKKRRRR